MQYLMNSVINSPAWLFKTRRHFTGGLNCDSQRLNKIIYFLEYKRHVCFCTRVTDYILDAVIINFDSTLITECNHFEYQVKQSINKHAPTEKK